MTNPVAYDLFGRETRLGDLVVYGNSGRYAGTRVARVYWIRDRNTVRVWLYSKRRGEWVRDGGHSQPHGFVRIDEFDGAPPRLESHLYKVEM